LALDLTTGRDFTIPRHRKEALNLVKKEAKSPLCKTQSVLRSLSSFKRDQEVVAAEKKEGNDHLCFAVDLSELQHANLRGFLLEQPTQAKSWKHPR